jgi:hypothetical protein
MCTTELSYQRQWSLPKDLAGTEKWVLEADSLALETNISQATSRPVAWQKILNKTRKPELDPAEQDRCST